jgi:TonB family protein
MHKSFSLIAAGLLFSQPVFAADQPSPTKAERDRQISEIIFQNYPPRAKAAGEQGPVFFVVKLDKDARATSCEVTHGSGHPLLDEETCELIVLHAVFKSAKDKDGNLGKQTAEGVVNWTLPGHTPEPQNPILLTGQNKPEKQICEKNLRMGTLSSVERICMTPSEWARQTDEMKQPWEEMRNKGYTNEAMGSGIEETKCAGGSFKC